MNIKSSSWNYKATEIEKIKESKTKLQLLNIINQLNPIHQNQNSTFLLLKIINVLFLKKILTSKVTNRLTQKCFKNLTTTPEKSLEKKEFLNPGLFDKNYRNTVFINSIYELINVAE